KRVIVLLTLAAAAFPQTHPPDPVINGAKIDVALTQVTINGVSFGDTKPAVMLDVVPLQVASYTDTTVVAFLPPNTPSGSYALTLTRSDPPPKTASFVVTIGQQGPVGPPGPAGS